MKLLRHSLGGGSALVIVGMWICPSLTLLAVTWGVPQEHPTIQAAINAAEPGDTVLVAAGTYRERIRMKEGVSVRSAGDDSAGKLGLARAERTVIDGGGEAGQGPGVEMAEGSTLDGFTVTRVGVYDEARWEHDFATRGEEQSHHDIGRVGEAGISVVGLRCVIRNNIVHHNGDTGIAIVGGPGRICSPLVTDNISFRNMGGGIGSMEGSAGVIQGNTCFENLYAGIGHSGASPLVVGNECRGNVRAGIGISAGSSPVVRGNRCHHNRRAGIGIRTGAETRPLVDANDCYENEMAGIGVRDGAAPVVRANRCYRNKLAGIGVRGGAHPTLVGNECFENGQAGIGHQGGVVSQVLNNHCHDNQAAGIGFESGEAGRSTLVGNRVVDNAAVAVGIHTGWQVWLNDNELSTKSGLPPVVMVFQGAEATLTGNVIRGGGVAGIRTAGVVRADRNRFEGTGLRRSGPPNFAVWALSGSRVELTANEIRGWRHAVQASEADVLAERNTVEDFFDEAFVVEKPSAPERVRDNVIIEK